MCECWGKQHNHHILVHASEISGEIPCSGARGNSHSSPDGPGAPLPCSAPRVLCVNCVTSLLVHLEGAVMGRCCPGFGFSCLPVDTAPPQLICPLEKQFLDWEPVALESWISPVSLQLMVLALNASWMEGFAPQCLQNGSAAITCWSWEVGALLGSAGGMLRAREKLHQESSLGIVG